MNRILDRINEVIKNLELDLQGKVVLTEGATGSYAVTSVIAALAGAEVYAFTKDTKYGSVAEVKTQTLELLHAFADVKSKINFITELTPDIICKADIITNSGHLRPLNEDKLKHIKPGAVISLMYEAWELREADLDLDYCRAKHIPVGATNERHPDVDVFNYLGDMALKMIFDAGLNPYRNKFILLCNNDFGPYIAKTLSLVCHSLAVCDKAENQSQYQNMKIDWLGNFPDLQVSEKYKYSDAIIFTAYPFDKNWIGDNTTLIPLEKLLSQITNPLLLRYAGDIDEAYCNKKISFYPMHVQSGHMGILPSEIGFDPIIRLQAGGLKVGEFLLRQKNSLHNIQIVDLPNY